MLASDTAEKPRVKPSQGSSERRAQPAPQPVQSPGATVTHAPAFDAIAPDAGTAAPDAAASETIRWQVRRANRIRFAALVGVTAAVAGLSLYGWNSLRPTELDELQSTLPARTSSGPVEPAAPAAVPPQPAAVAPTAIAPKAVQPAPPRPAANRTPVTHLRRGDAAVAKQSETKPNCAESVAALGLCK